jgi:sugar lactone lactonase YvrE
MTDATDRVTEVSPTGKVLRRWGGRGTRPGQFNFARQGSGDPTSLAVGVAVGSNGDVYVSDSGNARVEVFSPTGHFIRQFGSSLTASGHFLQPNDLVVDHRGNVYVADDEQNVVEKYSPSGSFLWQVGSGAGSSDPDLSGFLTLAGIDRHGLVPIASDSGAIVYLDSQGHKVDVFHTTAYLPHGIGPCDVTLDSRGDAFVQSCGPYALVFDRSHNLIAAWQHAPFPARSPRFGPRGEVFALGYQRGVVCNGCAPNVILKLKVALPGA